MNKLILSMFLFCFTVLSAKFPAFYGNQSSIRWKTATTEHFIFHYPFEYTEHAEIVAAHAEAVYDSVALRYRGKLPGKTNISLNNALYSNGQAIPGENTMHLWLTNWDFKIRSSHSWISDVVTHEFSHLISIANASKLPSFLYGFQLSYLDYYNERTTQNFFSFIPFTLLPLWFAEGTAQYESARMGFDSWDSHRDMLMRVAALEDQILDLEWMLSANSNSLYAELGPYTQGFSLVRYLSEKYGDSVIPKLWSALSRVHRMTLDGALKEVIGIGENELFEKWKTELKEHYEAQKNNLGEIVAGEKISTGAFYQDFPVVAGKHIYGISNFGGEWFDGGIFKLPKLFDSLEDSDSENHEITFELEGPVHLSDYAKSGFKAKKSWFSMGIDVKDFPERGLLLAYVTYQNRDRNGRAYFDIALADTNGNEQILTRYADAVYPEMNAKGTELVFVRREANSTRFVLSKMIIPESFKDSPEDVRDLFIPSSEFSYYNIYSPKFSPDGSKIVFGFFDDQVRGIALIDRDGKNFKVLTSEAVDARDANWIDDKQIVYSGNQNGIFNLYSLNIETNEQFPLTNVIGGAFTPVVDSNMIFYTGYDADGFSLYRMKWIDYSQTKDSVFTHTDTLISACPSEPVEFQEQENNCIAASNSQNPNDFSQVECAPSEILPKNLCKPDTVLAKKDSTVFVAQTKPLRLTGSLPGKNKVQQNKNTKSFSGIERSYKPIPSILTVVPLFSFEERAPDFNVLGEGKAIPKLGAALSLKDPLQKNFIQMALLLEIGNGFDYINSDGLNPRMSRDFFLGFENRSFPITLGLAYSHRNILGKDTIRYEDPRSHEDSIAVTNYAVPFHAFSGTAGYSIFKKCDSLEASLSYFWADFNLFEDHFQWTYHKQFSADISVSLFGGFPESDLNNTAGEGNGISLFYRYSLSDLYRPGTFSESFTVSSSGVIQPIYRTYHIHEVGASLFGSLPNPIHSGARFAAGASVNGILNWNSQDTTHLDDFYYHPLLLEGYPYLISNEDYNRSAMKVAKVQVHYLFPIYEDFRKHFWIFSTRDFFIDVYAQAGSAWNDHGIPFEKLKETRFWDRSIGLEFKISNTIFYNVPFDLSLNFARGLDRIGQDEDGRGGRKMNPLDLPLLPKSVSPTRISLTLGMGFDHRWMR